MNPLCIIENPFSFLDIKYVHPSVIDCGSDQIQMDTQPDREASQDVVAVCQECNVRLCGMDWAGLLRVMEVVSASLECWFNHALGKRSIAHFVLQVGRLLRHSSR